MIKFKREFLEFWLKQFWLKRYSNLVPTFWYFQNKETFNTIVGTISNIRWIGISITFLGRYNWYKLFHTGIIMFYTSLSFGNTLRLYFVHTLFTSCHTFFFPFAIQREHLLHCLSGLQETILKFSIWNWEFGIIILATNPSNVHQTAENCSELHLY